MDWLEEKAGELGKFLQEKSLVRALVCYLCIGMVGVAGVYWITKNICLGWIEVLLQRQNQVRYKHFWGFLEIWELLGEDGGREAVLLEVLNFFYNSCLYLYILVCFCIVGKLFLEAKVKQPLAIITQGLNYINMGDYSHEIIWQSQDEMGSLCREMEQMRAILLKSKKDQWKQQEEQRKINAAFAHDIRTPLTVICGYTEFLQKYVPKGKVSEEMLLEKLNTMREQEERLFRFSATMATIQKMEEWELCGGWHSVSELMGQMEAVIEGIRCSVTKEITLHTSLPEQEVFLDQNLLMEVFENLLSNGLRYARESIQVEVAMSGKEFMVFVKDDGPGFSEKALRNGTDTYFSEEEGSQEHFGIGLSISRMLCESHGGSLTLHNSVLQGAIAAAVLTAGVRDA